MLLKRKPIGRERSDGAHHRAVELHDEADVPQTMKE
jgi:hypothetical protein